MSVSGTNPNVLDLCRLCLVKDESLIPVFDSSQTNQLLCDKINLCLAVQISSEDRISQQICISCLFKIDSFYEFRVKSSESQQVLESWLQTSETTLQNDADLISKDINNGNDLVLFSNLSESNSCGDNESEGSDSSSSEDDSSSEESESADRENEPLYAELHPVSSNVVVSADAPGPSGLQAANNDNILPKYDSSENITIQGNTKAVNSIMSSKTSKDCLLKGDEKMVDRMQCEICGKKFMTAAKLANHSLIHSKNYSCNQCTYTNKSSSNLKIHMMKHNKQYLIECENCGKGFYNLSYYKEHKAVKHSTDIVVNKCKICDKAFHSKFYLNQHAKVHKPGFVKKTYQCEICGKTFLSWKGVKRHIKIIHEGNRYKCDICAKEVTCLQSLNHHKKIHSGEKTFVCDICGKGFIKMNNLIVHERIHSGEKPYRCNQCDKCFSQQTSLKIHKRCHSGERPYQCQLCNKRFVTLTLMKKHSRIHTDNNI